MERYNYKSKEKYLHVVFIDLGMRKLRVNNRICYIIYMIYDGKSGRNLRLGLIEFVKGEDLKNKSLEFFFGNDKS